MRKIFFLCLLASWLIGCATAPGYEFQFATQSIIPGKPANRLCKIHYENKDEKTIDGKIYIPQVEDLLKNKGITIVKDDVEGIDCLITVSHTTEYGKEQRVGHTWGQTGVSGSTSYTNASASVYGMGNSAYGYGQSTTYTTYRPTYGVTGTYTYDVARSYNSLFMQAVNTKTGEELWNSAISYAGNVDEKFTDLLPAFKCILSFNMLKNFTQKIFVSQKQLKQMYDGKCSEIQWDSDSEEIKKAHWGNVKDQVLLGGRYLHGIGVSVDYAKAFYWLSKAAEQGNATAEFALGGMYFDGSGVDRDYAKAIEWFSKAADQGHATAQAMLGGMYVWSDEDLRKFIPKDTTQALSWLNKSVEQHDALGEVILADLYYEGEGVKQDLNKAIEIYSNISDREDFAGSLAEARLSCYDKKIFTVKQHFDKCLAMAKQGNAKAQYAVAMAYREGAGTKKDLEKSYEWIKKAAKQDSRYKAIEQRFAEKLSKKK